jgi:hypothetical protein
MVPHWLWLTVTSTPDVTKFRPLKSILTYLLTYLITYLLHGAGYYLKRWLSLISSKKSHLWNPNVHHRVHKSPSLDTILSFLKACLMIKVKLSLCVSTARWGLTGEWTGQLHTPAASPPGTIPATHCVEATGHQEPIGTQGTNWILILQPVVSHFADWAILCVCVCVCVCLYGYVCMCVYVCMYVCMYVGMYVCVCMCVYGAGIA